MTVRHDGLDAFVGEHDIADPAAMHTMPQHTPIRRPDEVKAARQPVLRYTGEPV